MREDMGRCGEIWGDHAPGRGGGGRVRRAPIASEGGQLIVRHRQQRRDAAESDGALAPAHAREPTPHALLDNEITISSVRIEAGLLADDRDAIRAPLAHARVAEAHVVALGETCRERRVAHARRPPADLNSGGTEWHHEIAHKVGIQSPLLEASQGAAMGALGTAHGEQERLGTLTTLGVA